MSQYTSYYLYQKYEKRGEQDWIPVYPNTYSIDGDGTMQLSAKTENDPACGYVPVEPIYRWFEAPSTDYVCNGYNKYHKEYYQVSNDNGVTWTNVVPEQTRQGSLIEVNSSDCGYVPPVIEGKFKSIYSNETEYSIECDSNTTLTSADTRPSGYIFSAMTSAIIGDCVNIIDRIAFQNNPNHTSLTSVTISNNVTQIKGGVVWTGTTRSTLYGAFGGCSKLRSILLPPRLDKIEGATFYMCYNLFSVNFPSGITSIDESAFGECHSLNIDVVLPSSCTYIGKRAFEASAVKSLSAGTVDIDEAAFKTNGSNNFNSSLQTVNIQGGTIGTNAFSTCSALTSCNLGDVTSIGGGAFYKCTSLTGVTIGNSITSIGTSAFRDCSSLLSITIEATTPPTISSSSLMNTNNCIIYVPSVSVDTYKSASGWNGYANRIQAIS